MSTGRFVPHAVKLRYWQLEKRWYASWPGFAARLPLPDFLGIGAQKAGTSWLWENLRRHPEVFVPERKELHYFDNKFERSLHDYARRFAAAGNRIKGEITPAYGILPLERIRFIRAIMPKVRLIFMMRNPIERAWSQAVMDLVVRPGRRLEEVPESDFLAFLESEGSISRSRYSAILDTWLSVFPSEQLYVGFFEAIREAPRELLSELFAHIGVSRGVDWERFPVERVIQPRVGPAARESRERMQRTTADGNEGDAVRCPDAIRKRLEQLHGEEIERLSRRYGERVAHWRID
jgi:hypothetical protein